MKKFVSDYWSLFAVAGVIVLLDQITKYYVRANLAYGDIWSPWPWLAPYARIVHWRNTGAAFGMFQSMGGVFRILAIIVSLAILYYYPKVSREDWPLRLAMGFQLGGALGNLIDRLTVGSVTDFISVGNFAVFNIADACITLGVGILILGMWIKERQEVKDGQPTADAQENLSNGQSEQAAPTGQAAPTNQAAPEDQAALKDQAVTGAGGSDNHHGQAAPIEQAAPTEQAAPEELISSDEPQALDMGRASQDPLAPPFSKEIKSE